MKKIFNLFLLSLSFINVLAQSEIPLKKERAYFSFQNKVESQKTCASMFFDVKNYAEYNLLAQKNATLTTQSFSNDFFKGFGVTCIGILQNHKTNLQCSDEVRLMPNSYAFNITVLPPKKKATLKILNDEIKLKYPYAAPIKLEVNVKIIFKNKTEYELIFSDAYLVYYNKPKGERFPKVYRVELGEFYSSYKNSGEVYPDNELFFKTLVLTIENANKSLNQAIQECINFYD